MIWPNTGSMITFRREYSSRPHLFCHTGRIKVVDRLVHHWHRLTNVIRLIRDVCGNDNLLFVGHRLSIPALVETFVRSSLLCHPATVARPSATRLHDTESTRPETTAAGASDAEGESRRCGAKVRNVFAYDHPKSRVGGTAFHDFPQIKTKLRKVSGRASWSLSQPRCRPRARHLYGNWTIPVGLWHSVKRYKRHSRVCWRCGCQGWLATHGTH